MGKGFEKANWDFWNKIPKAELWQCVLLGLGIEPRGESFREIEEKANALKRPDILDRLFIAQQNISHGPNAALGPMFPAQNRPPLEKDFNIPQFIQWAKTLPWEMPKEFTGYAPPLAWKSLAQALVSQEHQSPSSGIQPEVVQGEKPLSDRERKSLQRIVGALLAETVSKDDKSKPFRSEAKLIERLSDQYDGYDGLSKANLEKVFKAAKQLLTE